MRLENLNNSESSFKVYARVLKDIDRAKVQVGQYVPEWVLKVSSANGVPMDGLQVRVGVTNPQAAKVDCPVKVVGKDGILVIDDVKMISLGHTQFVITPLIH
jgi:hypothetical protein